MTEEIKASHILVETEADRHNLEKVALELFAEEFESAEELPVVVES